MAKQRPGRKPGQKRKSAKQHAKDLLTEARRAEVVELRRKGYTFREIGRRLGINESNAYRAFAMVMDRTIATADATADQLRHLELERIDSALVIVLDVLEGQIIPSKDGEADDDDESKAANIMALLQAATGCAELKLKAVDRLVKLTEQRAKLQGLYAPTEAKVEETRVTAEATPEEAARLVRMAFGEKAMPKNETGDPKPGAASTVSSEPSES